MISNYFGGNGFTKTLLRRFIPKLHDGAHAVLKNLIIHLQFGV